MVKLLHWLLLVMSSLGPGILPGTAQAGSRLQSEIGGAAGHGILAPIQSSGKDSSDPCDDVRDIITPRQKLTGPCGVGVGESPSECFGHSDYPHNSSHVVGTVNGVARSDCEVAVYYLSVKAQLWESRWWGWDRVGVPGSDQRATAQSVSANSWWECRNNDFRITGYHESFEPTGAYVAETASPAISISC